MTSPADELSNTQSTAAEVALASPEDAAYGPDEERLVEQARTEAVLRLARAL